MLIISRIIFRASGGLTYGINGSFGSPEKKFGINFREVNPKFCLIFRYNCDNS